jgi:hypothetical protein
MQRTEMSAFRFTTTLSEAAEDELGLESGPGLTGYLWMFSGVTVLLVVAGVLAASLLLEMRGHAPSRLPHAEPATAAVSEQLPEAPDLAVDRAPYPATIRPAVIIVGTEEKAVMLAGALSSDRAYVTALGLPDFQESIVVVGPEDEYLFNAIVGDQMGPGIFDIVDLRD